jgi:hypothetical protein
LGGVIEQDDPILPKVSLERPPVNPLAEYERIASKRHELQASKVSAFEGPFMALGVGLAGGPAADKYRREKIEEGKKAVAGTDRDFNAARSSAMSAIENIVQDRIRDNVKEFTTSDLTGVSVPDPRKVKEWAQAVARENGLPEDGWAWKALNDKATDHIAFKIVQPRVDKAFERMWKEEKGKEVPKDVREYLGVNQKETEIERELISGLSQEKAQVEAQVEEQFAKVTGGMPVQEYVQMRDAAHEQRIRELQSRYAQFITPQGEFAGSPEQYAQYQSEFETTQKQYESEVSRTVGELTQIQANANRRFNRVRIERIEQAERTMQEFMSEKERLVPGLQKEIEDTYRKAYGKVLGENDSWREILYRDNKVMALGTSWASAVGGSVSRMGSLFASPEMQSTGKAMENFFYTGNPNMEKLSDWLDLFKSARSTGNLMGSMTTSMVPAVAAGVATGGLGGVALGTMMSWAGESADIAGGIAERIYNETGDPAKVQQGVSQAFSAQGLLLPTYFLEMSNIFGKIFTGGGLGRRIALGAGTEYVIETLFQEFPQQLFEESIVAGKGLEGVLDNFTPSNFEKTAGKLKDVALNTPSVMLMGGLGQARAYVDEKGSQEKREEQIANRLSSINSRMRAGDFTGTDFQQSALKLAVDFGVYEASKVAVATYFNGGITYETFTRIQQSLNDAKEITEKVNAMEGITDENRLLFSMINMEHRALERKAENEKDPIFKARAQKEANERKAMLDEIFEGGTPNYATAEFEDGNFTVMTPTGIKKAMSNPAFMQEVVDGKIKFNAFGKDSQQVVEEFAKTINDFKQNQRGKVDADIANRKKEQAQQEGYEAEREGYLIKREEELGIIPDIMEPAPKFVTAAITRVEDDKPTSLSQIEAASDWLYSEYKRISSLRDNPKENPLSQKRTNELLDAIGMDIEMLESAKGKMEAEDIAASDAPINQEPKTEESIQAQASKPSPAPTVNTTPTEARYASVDRNDGKDPVDLTKEEYLAEMERRGTPVEETATEAPQAEKKTESLQQEKTSIEQKMEDEIAKARDPFYYAPLPFPDGLARTPNNEKRWREEQEARIKEQMNEAEAAIRENYATQLQGIDEKISQANKPTPTEPTTQPVEAPVSESESNKEGVFSEGLTYTPKSNVTIDAFSEFDDEGVPQVRIDNMEVPKRDRMKGKGRAEFSEVEAWAREIGAERIIIESERDAIPFWKAIGFDIDNQGGEVSTGIYEIQPNPTQDALQEPSAETRPVRQEPETRQRVREEDTQEQEAAREGKAQEEVGAPDIASMSRESLLDYLFSLREDYSLVDVENEAEVSRIETEMDAVEAAIEKLPEPTEPKPVEETEQEFTEEEMEAAYAEREKELEEFKETTFFQDIQETFQPISIEEYERYMGKKTYRDNRRYLKGLVTEQGGTQPIDTRSKPNAAEDVEFFDPEDIIDFINTIAAERNITGESRYKIPPQRNRKERIGKPSPKKKVKTGDFLRNLAKEVAKGKIDNRGIAMSGIPGFVQAWNAAITAAEKTLEATAYMSDIVDFLVEHIRNSPQFMRMRPAQRKAYDLRGTVLREMGITEQQYNDSRVEAEKAKGKESVKKARAEERKKASEKMKALRESLEGKFKKYRQELKDKTRKDSDIIKSAQVDMRKDVRDAGISFNNVQASKLGRLISEVNPSNYEEKTSELKDYIEKLVASHNAKEAIEEARRIEKEQAKQRKRDEQERQELVSEISDALNIKKYGRKTQRTRKRKKVTITNQAIDSLRSLSELYAESISRMSMDELIALDAIIEDIVQTGKIERKASEAMMKARRQRIAGVTLEMAQRKAGMTFPIEGRQAVFNQISPAMGTEGGGNLVRLKDGTFLFPAKEGRDLSDTLPDEAFEGATLIIRPVPDMTQRQSDGFLNSIRDRANRMIGSVRSRMDVPRMLQALAQTKEDMDFLYETFILSNMISDEKVFSDRKMLKKKDEALKKSVFGSEDKAKKSLDKRTGIDLETTDKGVRYENVTNDEAIYIYNQVKQSGSIDKMMEAKMTVESILNIVNHVKSDPELKAYADGTISIYDSYLPTANDALEAGGYIGVAKVSNRKLKENLMSMSGESGLSEIEAARESVEQAEVNLSNNVDPADEAMLERRVERAKTNLDNAIKNVDAFNMKRVLMEAVYGSIENIPEFEEYSPRSVAGTDLSVQGPNEFFSQSAYDSKTAPSIVSGNLVERQSGGSLRLESAQEMMAKYIDSMPVSAHKMQDFEAAWAAFHNSSPVLTSAKKIYGDGFGEALQMMMFDTVTGKPSQIANLSDKMGSDTMLKWLLYSSSDIMFFNMRSAIFQMLSAPNFIVDAFTEYGIGREYMQKMFDRETYSTASQEIFESGQFYNRVKYSSNPDIRDMISTRKTRGANAAAKWYIDKVKKIYEKGYSPTQFVDSNITIAYAGAPLYAALKERNIKENLEKGMDENLARERGAEKAMAQFWTNANKTQQSSLNMFRSIEQSSRNPLVRMFLTFGSVSLLMTRAMAETASDVKNGRVGKLEGAARIAYYGAVQNLMFYTAQSGILWLMGSDDDDERKELIRQQKTVGILNDSFNNVLRGLGAYGAVLSFAKDFAMSEYFRSLKNDEKNEFKKDLKVLEKMTASGSVGNNLVRKGVKMVPAIDVRVRDIEKALAAIRNDKTGEARGEAERLWMMMDAPVQVFSATGLAPGIRTASRIVDGIMDASYEQLSAAEAASRVTGLMSRYDMEQMSEKATPPESIIKESEKKKAEEKEAAITEILESIKEKRGNSYMMKSLVTTPKTRLDKIGADKSTIAQRFNVGVFKETDGKEDKELLKALVTNDGNGNTFVSADQLAKNYVSISKEGISEQHLGRIRKAMKHLDQKAKSAYMLKFKNKYKEYIQLIESQSK